MQKEEVLINQFSIEEMEGMEQEAENNLFHRILVVDESEKIVISDLITAMRKRLKYEILLKNN